MDLRAQSYRCFVVLAEEASFTRAAARLNITQSALSMRIGNLERQLGVRLFHRSSRSVSLTAEGAELMDFARRIVDETDRFHTLADEIRKGPERPLVFAMPIVATGTKEWMALVDRFRKREPSIATKIVRQATADLIVALRNEQLDIGFMTGRAPEDLTSLVLMRNPISLWIPREWPLAARTKITTADLAKLRIAAFDREINPGFFDQSLAPLEKAGAELVYAPERIIAAGFAGRERIATIGIEGLQAPPARDKMVLCQLSGIRPAVDFCVMRSPRSTRRVVRRFWDLATRYVRAQTR